ncbi:hypothetical protein CN495_07435 [Bacillus thuringiensis]|uniref:Uncharacterized protein n=1 Tax=Bacillus thuringiensis TaxID=1428 RepID=A0ABD6SA56_BACTU|nr:hypothetical protein [Bacillus thuringiensis]PER55578.1 hypothetical protein CN495_07435 [Bacillus thuringiensis]
MKARVANVLNRLNAVREDVRMTEREQEVIEGYINRNREAIAEKQAKITLCDKSEIVLKNIADERNEGAKKALTDILNYALSNVQLEQRYKARLEEHINRRVGKELTVVLTDLDTGYERSLKYQTGTAVSQIIGLLMTIITIKFSKCSRFLILDEKLSGLQDEETILMFGEILSALAQNEDFQILMVEHKSHLKAVEGITVIPLTLPDYQTGLTVAG